MFPTFDRLLSLVLVTAMIGGHGHHHRDRGPRATLQAIQPLLPAPHAALAAGSASTTVPRLPASSTSCAPASLGGYCPPGSWAAVARSPAGGGFATGSAPACGSGRATCSLMSSAATARSTGPAPAWTRSGCAKRGGALTGPNPTDRGKPGSKVPPAGRSSWRFAGGRAVSGQHPGLGAVGGCCRCGPADQRTSRAAGSAAQAARQAAPGQGLRTIPLSAGAAPPWHHPTHRPPRGRATRQARPPPLRGGAVAGVAGGPPAAAGPLRATRRPPAGLPSPGLRAHLPCSGLAPGRLCGPAGTRPGVA